MRSVIHLYQVGRFHLFTGHEGPQGQQRYSSTLFQTSALEGGEGSASSPGSTLPLAKTRYPLYTRLGGPQGRSGQVRKISPHRDSIPGPSSPQAVAIPTELPNPIHICINFLKQKNTLIILLFSQVAVKAKIKEDCKWCTL